MKKGNFFDIFRSNRCDDEQLEKYKFTIITNALKIKPTNYTSSKSLNIITNIIKFVFSNNLFTVVF